MKKAEVILCGILIIGLCFPLCNTVNGGEARHYHSVTTFQGGFEEKVLTFMMEGEDSSLVVELPDKAKIESATLDIEGRLVAPNAKTISNFTDTINNRAWEDATNQQYPVTSPPSTFMTTSFSVSDYNDVNTLDFINKSTIGGVASSGYPLQLYEFNLSKYAVIKFDVFWAGAYMSWNSGSSDGMNVSIWNQTGKTWEIIDGYYHSWGMQPKKERFFNKSFSASPMDYIHPSSKLLYVIVVGPYGAGFSYCEIFTDYIGINITQISTPSYPKDPYLDIGDDEDDEWNFDGDLTIKKCFSGETFINELQEHVNSGTAVMGMIHIPFVFGVAEVGELFISNLTIVFATNKHPNNFIDISSISFNEDSGWYSTGINLTYYFNDADDPISNLTFEIHGNTPNIWGVITSDHILNFTSSANYFGTTEFNISCRDNGYDEIPSSDDIIVYSNNFTVTVKPTDDPPVIRYIDDTTVMDNEFFLEAEEDEQIHFTVMVEDIDGDEIIYSVDITDSGLNMNGNVISFFPRQEHVGLFNFTIKATEINTSELYDFVNMTIDVKNINDGPIFEELNETFVVDEDEWLNITLNAKDPDVPYDELEQLSYKTNFSDSGIDAKLWNFDEETGNFSFLPDNSQVGRYFINFSVQDNYEEKDWCHTTIEVKNVNDPPRTQPISFLIVDADNTTPELENLSVSFSTKTADDPDLIYGDVLSYSWDFDISDGVLIDAIGQGVDWTFSKPGNYTVTLTVTDTGSPRLSNRTSIVVQVLAPKEPKPKPEPEDQNNETKEGKSDKERDEGGIALGILISIMVIILVLIIAGILGMVMWKKRQNRLKGEIDKPKVEVFSPSMSYPSSPDQIPWSIPMQQTYGTPEQDVRPYQMQPGYYMEPEIPMSNNMPPNVQPAQMETTQQQQKNDF